MSTVKCSKCNWYHYAQSRDEVRQQAEDFKRHFDALPFEMQRRYYSDLAGKPYDVEAAVARSERCYSCGSSYKDCVDDNQCPTGVTLQGIIQDEIKSPQDLINRAVASDGIDIDITPLLGNG